MQEIQEKESTQASYNGANLIWSIAELLRGDYKQYEFENVILPLVVLRRLDCVLSKTKEKVLEIFKNLEKSLPSNVDMDQIISPPLQLASGLSFYNISEFDFPTLINDPKNIDKNFKNYINGFSSNMREIIDMFEFTKEIDKLHSKNLLYKVINRFTTDIDLSPEKVSNHDMGYIYEELIRKFAEQANETAGEHYTPREVIRLIVSILFSANQDFLKLQEGRIISIYDCACGTGGMLTTGKEHIETNISNKIKVELYGQEIQDKTYSIAKSDMLIKDETPDNIKHGNTLSNDLLKTNKFDYMLTNPPFGVDWSKIKESIEEEAGLGFTGRFGAGLPRTSDGQLLFLLHLVSKMKPISSGGSRIAIVFNGSPLFTGDAGSGESEIRRYLIENDLLEAIIALPNQLFYNTGINTYVWIVSNNKEEKRKGKIQLINAVDFYKKMRKSLGQKRNELSPEDTLNILNLYTTFENNEHCKIYDNNFFGYSKITIEQPLRLKFHVTEEKINNLYNESSFQNLATSKKKNQEEAEKDIKEGKELQEKIVSILYTLISDEVCFNRNVFMDKLKAKFKKSDVKLASAIEKAIINVLSEKDEEAEICTNSKGQPESDSELRDNESVPLTEDIEAYFEREVKPHVKDAWIDHEKTKIGYEVNFTKYFYKFTPLRDLAEIDAEIETIENEIQALLKEI